MPGRHLGRTGCLCTLCTGICACSAGLPNQTSGSRLLAPPRAVLWGTTPLPGDSGASGGPPAQVARLTERAMALSIPDAMFLCARRLWHHGCAALAAQQNAQLVVPNPAAAERDTMADVAGCCRNELPRQPGRGRAGDERSGELAAQRRLPAFADTQVRPFGNRALCT